MMKRVLMIATLPLALAACGDSRLTPPPGEAPGWPVTSPPNPSYAPLPFSRNYAPVTGQIQDSPPARADGTIPYGVRGQAAQPAAAAAPAPCHKVPTVTYEGKPASTVCQQADGSWGYIPD